MQKVLSIIYPKYNSINVYTLFNEAEKGFCNKENIEVINDFFLNILILK